MAQSSWLTNEAGRGAGPTERSVLLGFVPELQHADAHLLGRVFDVLHGLANPRLGGLVAPDGLGDVLLDGGQNLLDAIECFHGEAFLGEMMPERYQYMP